VIAARRKGRANDALRPVTIEPGVAEFADGSALVSFGRTRVWCTASIDERVPAWLVGRGSGWVTAEYAMLPRSGAQRTSRERATNSGRSQEISRLIGRSLRAAVDLKRLGERSITIDCDVLQADGGTRTAAVTGGYVALALACERIVASVPLKVSPLVLPVAAVSVGIVNGEARLDLDYPEDSTAAVDCNVVMNGRGDLIEVQSTAEAHAYSRAQLEAMLDLAANGIAELVRLQQLALGK
jgi:ribonuclease PH